MDLSKCFNSYEWKLLDEGSGTTRYNFTGLIRASEYGGKTEGYSQWFANGGAEIVQYSLKGSSDKNVISAWYLRNAIVSIPAYVRLLRELAVQEPFYFGVAILNSEGCYLYPRESRMLDMAKPILEKNLVPLLVEMPNLEADMIRAMRLIHDPIWRAGGFSRSLHYSPEGELLKER